MQAEASVSGKVMRASRIVRTPHHCGGDVDSADSSRDGDAGQAKKPCAV
jgi:hypothetical protein